jgi:hypothetical protein
MGPCELSASVWRCALVVHSLLYWEELGCVFLIGYLVQVPVPSCRAGCNLLALLFLITASCLVQALNHVATTEPTPSLAITYYSPFCILLNSPIRDSESLIVLMSISSLTPRSLPSPLISNARSP